MKFLHLADLHIGKRVNGFSMLGEQEHILRQILTFVEREQPNAVLLCGDIYDKPLPPTEAVQLFDKFLTELSGLCAAVLIISGNHDSAERLAFAADMLKERGVYLAKPFGGSMECVRLFDEWGAVDFWLLPFVKPIQVRRCYEGGVDNNDDNDMNREEIATYDDAVARIMRDFRPNEGVRSVLLAHQLLTGAATCESEELAIGGLDNVSAEHFAAFDYVALGHLHGAQRVVRDEVRYAGSPLKYSFSEARQTKSMVLAEMDGEGAVKIRLEQLYPLHDMREIRGSFAELYSAEGSEDYLHITLTDEDDVMNAVGLLEQKYPNLMKLDYDNRRTRERKEPGRAAELNKSPLELFEEFYRRQNNQELKDEQRDLLRQLIEEIWEDEPAEKDIRREELDEDIKGVRK